MNLLIEEFALRCKEYKLQVDGARVDFDYKKFAELIVRECADLIDNKEMITALQTYDEVFVAKYDTKEQCSKQILEHFGVEP